ncbi:hypothetical protein HYN59_00445 [Flavobacterium album]|uniref:Uncharacterized protein n=1 Tax=Flavobacterium album TaxID=2175091 RepID=A0A2S1QTG5_9FLAO|nr:cytochrome c oxidase assembly factor Coa1 family protein [Flavobacterium album]AWH83675.1 hypothetical protein HYN59_00445 [Flavobacterium album]
MENKITSYDQILEANKRRKRKTAMIVIPIVVAVIALVVTGIFMIASFVKNTDAYKAAVEHLGNDPEIQAATGGINDYSVSSFNIKTENGRGEATFDITVEGKSNNIDVYMELEKEPDNDWKVISVEK